MPWTRSTFTVTTDNGASSVTTTTGDAPPVSATLARMSAGARELASKSRAKRTLDGYASDWSAWQTWCAARNVQSRPAAPEHVAEYITASTATHKAGTIARRLAAISWAHRTAGHADPVKDVAVQHVAAGMRRTIGTAQEGRAPLVLEDLRRLVAPLTASMLDTRDRALLLLGFAMAARRSELVALDREHLVVTSEGLRVTIIRSKTDQEGSGEELGVPYGTNPETCPVRSVLRWLEVAGITTGPVFRPIDKRGRIVEAGRKVRRGGLSSGRLSAQVVAQVVKRRAAAAGIDAGKLSGHSLRRGLATTAALAGVPDRLIQQAGRWKSPAMVTRYTRSACVFADSVVGRLGL